MFLYVEEMRSRGMLSTFVCVRTIFLAMIYRFIDNVYFSTYFTLMGLVNDVVRIESTFAKLSYHLDEPKSIMIFLKTIVSKILATETIDNILGTSLKIKYTCN